MKRIVVSHQSDGSERCILLEAPLFLRFMRRVRAVHAAGLTSYGVFLADPKLGHDDASPSEAYFFDPGNNRRNDAGHRRAFEAQGAHFRRYRDAGFVVDPDEVRALSNRTHRTGELAAGLFHAHRREAASFSVIDYRLHNPLFRWHLVVSMRDPKRPTVQPFAVDKPLDDHGISEHDRDGDGEASYLGPEVQPIHLLIEGSPALLLAAKRVLEGGDPGRIAEPLAA